MEDSDLFVNAIKESALGEVRFLAVRVEENEEVNTEDDLNIVEFTNACIEEAMTYLEFRCKDRACDGKSVEDAIKEIVNASETDKGVCYTILS